MGPVEGLKLIATSHNLMVSWSEPINWDQCDLSYVLTIEGTEVSHLYVTKNKSFTCYLYNDVHITIYPITSEELIGPSKTVSYVAIDKTFTDVQCLT